MHVDMISQSEHNVSLI